MTTTVQEILKDLKIKTYVLGEYRHCPRCACATIDQLKELPAEECRRAAALEARRIVQKLRAKPSAE